MPALRERPRALLADDHPAMHALTAAALAGEYLVVGSGGANCSLRRSGSILMSSCSDTN
jgi:hypothetical protein